MSAEPLLTTEDVAALLQVHPKHVYRLLRRGLPGHRMGGEWRFARDEVLRWVERRAIAAPVEGEDAGEVPAGTTIVTAPSLVAANGDVAVEVLLAQVNAEAPPLLGFVQADRDAAMALLAASHVLAAGCHAMGPPSHLAGARLARIHLVTRTIGLAGRWPDRSLAALATLRLAVRPSTAGVRAHLDAALTDAGLDPAAILAGAAPYDSHRDALLAVVRGDADVALTTEAWAARVGLPFHALTTEAYGLVVRAADLGDPRVVRLCEVAQRASYRSALATVRGYDATGAGDIRYDGTAAG
ncbi:MAG: helix-turn-helix transcriptional regulator [Myxococcota bacterium]